MHIFMGFQGLKHKFRLSAILSSRIVSKSKLSRVTVITYFAKILGKSLHFGDGCNPYGHGVVSAGNSQQFGRTLWRQDFKNEVCCILFLLHSMCYSLLCFSKIVHFGVISKITFFGVDTTTTAGLNSMHVCSKYFFPVALLDVIYIFILAHG